ncbi:hypothetical protein DFQ01_1063 [Paenibacillus cellulosilyticus]|uniref:Membrane protein NfeD2 N-terminal transmembrane domain-containing protein n=1 Tax=Paenibacillus cellulosilyticus TaxID=375489 RepID=A0A2V2YYB9_9BACL|nr:NfeD family protein [Paenibacillus cellulosilyticus]PWW04722.1 hypothetical protein DFQ01_1063 [Paenibacillus cellulosilyticus]QKS45849.1 NfeD family protein [Paenibacillus cellulosilyticus]
METLFLSCLIGGILFAIVSVLLGDWLSASLDGALDFLSVEGYSLFRPTVIACWVTVFGGAGLLLNKYTEMGNIIVLILTFLIATAFAVLLYFAYIRPMEQSENSVGFSIQELAGQIGEVIVPIPDNGFGEVMVQMGAARSHHIASSFDGTAIPSEAKVIVVEVDAAEGVLFVSKFDI